VDKKDQKILFWMNCYGGWDPSLRHPIETIGYDQYLDAFVNIVDLLSDRVGVILISGGTKDQFRRTECETTKPELEKRLKSLGISTNILTDEESVTSQMILAKFLKTWQEEYNDFLPLLFVDDNRFLTNLFVFEHYAKKYGINLKPRDVIVPLQRIDNHPHSTKEFQAEKIKKMKELGIEEFSRQEIKERADRLGK